MHLRSQMGRHRRGRRSQVPQRSRNQHGLGRRARTIDRSRREFSLQKDVENHVQSESSHETGDVHFQDAIKDTSNHARVE